MGRLRQGRIEEEVLGVMRRTCRAYRAGDVAAYRETTSREELHFLRVVLSPQRIDGLDFHLRELRVHRLVVGGGPTRLGSEDQTLEHEVLNPHVQVYGPTAIVTFTLMVRAASPGNVVHKSHNETRVFHDFGTAEKPEWKLVHCHKSPIATPDSLHVLRS